MSKREVVVLGNESIRGAVGTASPRGWRWRRPEAALRHAAGTTSACVRLEHPDAPLSVLIARSGTRFRAVLRRGDTAHASDRLDHDPERVAETLDDCPVIEDLVRELERGAAP